MEIRIHELLNGYEDSSVPMEETDVVSAMRIKELTEMKINYNRLWKLLIDKNMKKIMPINLLLLLQIWRFLEEGIQCCLL